MNEFFHFQKGPIYILEEYMLEIFQFETNDLIGWFSKLFLTIKRW